MTLLSPSALHPNWHSFGNRRGGSRKRNNQKRKFEHKNIAIMTIKPLADRVLVLPAPAEEKVGGIIIPDTAKEKPQRGEIVAVGQGTKDDPMVLKKGDTVLYGKYAGTELEDGDKKYLMMRQSDVLAVVED
jgi:chaperonin GroES